MPFVLKLLSVIATSLFAFVVLSKLGLPWLFSIPLAMVAGYAIWCWENAERNDESQLEKYFGTFSDIKDITKYVTKIF